jgi:hypothetical protein
MTVEKETRDEFHRRCLPTTRNPSADVLLHSHSSFLPDQIGMFSSSRHLANDFSSRLCIGEDDFELTNTGFLKLLDDSILFLMTSIVGMVNDSGGSDYFL